MRNFTEEEKRNPNFYQPFTKQCGRFTEGRVLGTPENDLRSRVDVVDSISSNVGQLFLRFPGDTRVYVGSGTLINLGGPENMVLTCAHNVWQYSRLDKSEKMMEHGEFYPCKTKKQEPTMYIIDSKKIHVYPGYHDDPFEGTDLALLGISEVIINFHDKISRPCFPLNSFWGKYCESDLQCAAKVCGYPADDDDKSGDPYEMKGTIKGIVNGNGKDVYVATYNTIDTTFGQSGGPLLVERKPNEWTIIGVHVANEPVSNCNVATLFTGKAMTWLKQKFDNPHPQRSTHENSVESGNKI